MALFLCVGHDTRQLRCISLHNVQVASVVSRLLVIGLGDQLDLLHDLLLPDHALEGAQKEVDTEVLIILRFYDLVDLEAYHLQLLQ